MSRWFLSGCYRKTQMDFGPPQSGYDAELDAAAQLAPQRDPDKGLDR
jgi:hypothetical protein